ncbi:hypothetical protein N646_1025 [Vibrio alginolyticus NBRC 15630 = ATCC 17749]|uniref:Uncharacterized protein n=1 Tax=Vibrio alginolyticus (strain ATCC 17749 / DSM 2171 / NBRC 15630 / NCIMB 1903 / NCTC 12160 / XII-53) TaxID=1219076 RepID=A0A2I3C6L0_VIBAX|nr:hypothetical protein N646_1025 [Vibrio alginolyticus NBRC 15630 = ATCC 17749]
MQWQNEQSLESIRQRVRYLTKSVTEKKFEIFKKYEKGLTFSC